MIKLVKSTFYQEEDTKKKLSKFITDSNYLSLGAECIKFEKAFAKYQGRKYCIFYNSGSSANLALLQSLYNLGRIKKGDSAAFSAISWPTNVSPIIQLGLNPILVDIELDTLNVSSKKLNEVLKKSSLKLFFLTNLLGFCDDIEKIQQICKRNKVILIEDNCESLGTVYKGKKLGNYGLASTFSFFVGHHMSTIEGGAVCTDDKELWIMLNMVRAHGWDRNLPQEEQKKLRTKFKVSSSFYAKYTFYELAYNLRPMEINAFIGNLQLKIINEINIIRNKNFFRIAPILYAETDKYLPVKYKHIDFLSNFAIPLICKSEKIRNLLIKKCKDKIEIRPIVGGDMIEQPFFIKYSPESAKLLKRSNAALIHRQGLYFGNNPELTDSEIEQIINIFS